MQSDGNKLMCNPELPVVSTLIHLSGKPMNFTPFCGNEDRTLTRQNKAKAAVISRGSYWMSRFLPIFSVQGKLSKSLKILSSFILSPLCKGVPVLWKLSQMYPQKSKHK